MEESKIQRDNFISLQGWMLTDLKLKGNELIIYACIYGFSQAENQVFSGSIQYLADWTNSTKQSVIKCLKSLVEKGYIVKNENIINGVKFCEYYATKFNGVLNNVEWGIKQSLTGGIKQSLPNNIDINNIEYNIDKDNYIGGVNTRSEQDDLVSQLREKYDVPGEKKTRKAFSPPSVDEVKAYCSERKNSVDAEKFVDYYSSNGWMVGKNKMKDWKAAVRTWEKNQYGNQKKTSSVSDTSKFKNYTEDELPF